MDVIWFNILRKTERQQSCGNKLLPEKTSCFPITVLVTELQLCSLETIVIRIINLFSLTANVIHINNMLF